MANEIIAIYRPHNVAPDYLGPEELLAGLVGAEATWVPHTAAPHPQPTAMTFPSVAAAMALVRSHPALADAWPLVMSNRVMS